MQAAANHDTEMYLELRLPDSTPPAPLWIDCQVCQGLQSTDDDNMWARSLMQSLFEGVLHCVPLLTEMVTIGNEGIGCF